MFESKNKIEFWGKKARHSFHLVDNSQLPLATSLTAFLLVLSFVLYWNFNELLEVYIIDRYVFQLAWVEFVLVLFCWFCSVLGESEAGHHTNAVRSGLRLGTVLFIVSEVMFFFAFFWAFFHVSLSPVRSSWMCMITIRSSEGKCLRYFHWLIRFCYYLQV